MLMTQETVRHKAGMASPPHILVVEDDREISALVAKYLRANECRVSYGLRLISSGWLAWATSGSLSRD